MIDSKIEPLPGEGKGIKQAEVTLFTFAEACAQPSAKRFVFHGSDGPVHAVEVDGTFFIQNDEAEAKAARSNPAGGGIAKIGVRSLSSGTGSGRRHACDSQQAAADDESV